MKKQILNTESYSPLYKQLMQKLRADIQSGVYPVHSRIPSEQELCETYQVSRVTVRKALSELTQEGLLKRHQGKGTFVGIPRIQKDLRNVNSFHDACRMMGCTPGTRVLHVQWTHPEEADRVALGCEADEQVVEIVRLRLADRYARDAGNQSFSPGLRLADGGGSERLAVRAAGGEGHGSPSGHP